jgi:hypothetical protein
MAAALAVHFHQMIETSHHTDIGEATHQTATTVLTFDKPTVGGGVQLSPS